MKDSDIQIQETLQTALKHQQDGKLSQAADLYLSILQKQPANTDALHLLGMIAYATNKYDLALELIGKAIALKSSVPDFYNNQGLVWQAKGNIRKAIECFQKVIQLSPSSFDAHHNFGILFHDQGQSSKAICYFQKAIQINPQCYETHRALGMTLRDQGKIPEAISAFKKALELKPTCIHTHSNLVFCYNLLADCDPKKIYEEHRLWAKQHADHLKEFLPPLTNNHDPNRKLHVGYISPYFYEQPVTYFMEPIFKNHNPTQFHITCYHDSLKNDHVTQRLQEHVAQWHQSAKWNDSQLAEQINKDKIDILVDLSGHLAHNRLLLFARRAAPIQITYLYQSTTGLKTMDYRITDLHADPPGMEKYYTEKLLHLPNSYWCYQPPQNTPDISPLPALKSHYVTFACTNHILKVGPHAILVWSRILQAIPHSRLLITIHENNHDRDDVIKLFSKNGISSNRLTFISRQPFNEYLNLFHQIDISLDTFPFNGGTTTCEALWMGSPVITLAGNSCISRGGISILTTIGLKELIAQTEEEYTEIAIRLASNLKNLSQLRTQLREKMRTSPLMNAQDFTHDLELAYRKIWQKWCEEQSGGRDSVRASG